MEHGATLRNAMDDVMGRLKRDFDADVGIIAVDSSGTPLAMHLTRDMPHAYFAADGDIVSRMRA
jgi:isoaspartyl peptidase/L-asparaginase-like protein (Ntn-hydrolase superfamily)